MGGGDGSLIRSQGNGRRGANAIQRDEDGMIADGKCGSPCGCTVKVSLASVRPGKDHVCWNETCRMAIYNIFCILRMRGGGVVLISRIALARVKGGVILWSRWRVSTGKLW